MKLKFSLFFVLAIVFANQLNAQDNATALLEKAYKQAKSENKNIFVAFQASWCSWCKVMEKNMNNENCKTLFTDNYVIVHLSVNESEKKQHLETVGAKALLKKWGGQKAGLPFFVMLDKKGEVLGNSFDDDGKNMGCPTSEKEVTSFLSTLKKTSKLKKSELSNIGDVFREKKQP